MFHCDVSIVRALKKTSKYCRIKPQNIIVTKDETPLTLDRCGAYDPLWYNRRNSTISPVSKCE